VGGVVRVQLLPTGLLLPLDAQTAWTRRDGDESEWRYCEGTRSFKVGDGCGQAMVVGRRWLWAGDGCVSFHWRLANIITDEYYYCYGFAGYSQMQ
jgi:hypothetical protein